MAVHADVLFDSYCSPGANSQHMYMYMYLYLYLYLYFYFYFYLYLYMYMYMYMYMLMMHIIPLTVLALWGSQLVLRGGVLELRISGSRWDRSWDPSWDPRPKNNDSHENCFFLFFARKPSNYHGLCAKSLQNQRKTHVFVQKVCKT